MKKTQPAASLDATTEAFLVGGLARRWRKYRRAFKRCRRKFSEKSIHQLRVETRRMMAFLSLLDPLLSEPCLTEAERCFKRLFKSTSRLRDTHVQLLFLDQHTADFPELIPFQKHLARREKRLTRRLEKKTARGLKPKLKRTLKLLRETMKTRLCRSDDRQSCREKILQAVDAAFRRVLVLRHRAQRTKPETIHCLRIAFKKFRYMVEALQPVLPGATDQRLAEFQAYQNLMGEIQDTEVLRVNLETFAAKQGVKPQHFVEYLRQRHTRQIEGFLRDADRVKTFWPKTRQANRAAKTSNRTKPT